MNRWQWNKEFPKWSVSWQNEQLQRVNGPKYTAYGSHSMVPDRVYPQINNTEQYDK